MSNIRDVAKLSEVSISTVSRYLSNDITFKISEETRHCIDAAVDQLQYKYIPKEVNKIKARIGCILAHTSRKYGDPFFNSILAAIEDECKNVNFSICSIKHCNDLLNPNILEDLCNLQLDGLIIMEEIQENIFNTLKENIKCIVGIDPSSNKINNVGFDHITSTLQAMNFLISNDYHKIAYIGGSNQGASFYDSYRLIAYREALRLANIPYDESIVLDCEWDINLCASLIRTLLIEHPDIDAIFAGSDTLASVIFGVLHDLLLNCPNDISVIGFNNLEISAHYVPALTTISIPTQDIGKMAVTRLNQLISTNDKNIISINFPTELVIRNSVKLKGSK